MRLFLLIFKHCDVESLLPDLPLELTFRQKAIVCVCLRYCYCSRFSTKVLLCTVEAAAFNFFFRDVNHNRPRPKHKRKLSLSLFLIGNEWSTHIAFSPLCSMHALLGDVNLCGCWRGSSFSILVAFISGDWCSTRLLRWQQRHSDRYTSTARSALVVAFRKVACEASCCCCC